MRIEANYNILALALLGVLLILAFAKANVPRKPYKIVLAVAGAMTMPSFFPGHGEWVMIIPTGALFAEVSTEAKVVGGVFTLVNFIIIWFLFYKIVGLFGGKT